MREQSRAVELIKRFFGAEFMRDKRQSMARGKKMPSPHKAQSERRNDAQRARGAGVEPRP